MFFLAKKIWIDTFVLLSKSSTQIYTSPEYVEQLLREQNLELNDYCLVPLESYDSFNYRIIWTERKTLEG